MRKGGQYAPPEPLRTQTFTTYVPPGEAEDRRALTLRVPSFLRDRIYEAAVREGITMNDWMMRVLEETLARDHA